LKRITIADVAAQAGVDRSVVSRVLSGATSLNVRDSTRERVMQIARDLNYRPNALARSLRTSKASAYGLLIPDFSNPIYASIIKGAERAAANVSSVLLTGSSAGDGFRTQGFLEVLGQGRVDGLLLAGDHGFERILEQLRILGLPWLMLNRRLSGVERSVILDDEGASELAVSHLVQLGHRRIAHLAGPDRADTAARRLSGYIKALERAGLPFETELLETSDYTTDGGSASMTRLLRRQTPTAVFVANVASAIGAMHAIKEAGFRIPHDISVVAVHDLPLVRYLDPPLTTVRMPLEELGQRGVERLVSTAADESINEILSAPIELIVRGSSAPPKGQS
jgi:LacI family transcriptional regulator